MHIHTRTSSSRYGVQIRLFFQFLTFFPFVIKEADRVDVVLILSSGVWDPVDAERLSPSNRNAVPAPSRSYCLQEHTHGNGNASFKSSSSSSLVKRRPFELLASTWYTTSKTVIIVLSSPVKIWVIQRLDFRPVWSSWRGEGQDCRNRNVTQTMFFFYLSQIWVNYTYTAHMTK